MATDGWNAETAIPEIMLLVGQIGDAIDFSFEDAELPATSEHLNRDGALEYHFETDDRWGFIAASPDKSVETTYPGWNTITIEAGRVAVFFEGTFAGVVSPSGGRIGGYALLDCDGHGGDLETMMLGAFRAEREAVIGTDGEQAGPTGR